MQGAHVKFLAAKKTTIIFLKNGEKEILEYTEYTAMLKKTY